MISIQFTNKFFPRKDIFFFFLGKKKKKIQISFHNGRFPLENHKFLLKNFLYKTMFSFIEANIYRHITAKENFSLSLHRK